MKFITIIVFIFMNLHFGFGQNLILGNEFKVNTYSDTTQREPAIASDGYGNYVIVWSSINQDGSESGIYGQRLNANDEKVGSEFRINTTTLKTQYRPSVDMNSSGRFIVVWASMVNINSSFDIFVQVFDESGNKVGSEILVNTTTANSQNYPDVAIDASGNFCVVWQSWFQDGSDKGIYAQRFSSSGNKNGAEFLVNTTTAYSQGRPSIDMSPDGRFVIVWESWKQDNFLPSGYGMYGQRYSSDGSKLGSEFQINTFTNDYQWFGDAAMDQYGNFIVVWCSWRQDGHDGGIFGQRYFQDGNKNGNEFQINTTTAYYQWLPKVAAAKDSSFAVIWSSWKQDGSREGVYARLFDKFGRYKSFEFRMNEYTENYQWEPGIAFGNENELIAVWSSWDQSSGKDYDIYARRIKPDIPQGKIIETAVNHVEGLSTSKIKVHLIDSTLTTGELYRVTFNKLNKDSIYSSVKNVTKNENRVLNFGIDKGANHFYLTQAFEGVAVEFNPDFNLELNLVESFAQINSASNLIYSFTNPTVGKKETAPMDLVLSFGRTDTSSDGKYIYPLDTALSRTGARVIIVPFKVFNLKDGQKLNSLVLENSGMLNNKWDAGESIVVLTPPPYATGSTSTHCQINNSPPAGLQPTLPNQGDSVFVLTHRPLTNEDVFEFTTQRNNFIVGVKDVHSNPEKFELFQNYPNPFNPVTNIKFQISYTSHVTLKVFDILGREVAKIVNEIKEAGTYNYQFSIMPSGRQVLNSQLPSGIYFYQLSVDNRISIKKMVLMK
ncbi:MAG: T9SS type A sorting domain-containing protein [Ignavibacteria bacterium]|nr:T9SS type A sorting domain-containing protein [Ignavibacteria bacterium]